MDASVIEKLNFAVLPTQDLHRIIKYAELELLEADKLEGKERGVTWVRLSMKILDTAAETGSHILLSNLKRYLKSQINKCLRPKAKPDSKILLSSLNKLLDYIQNIFEDSDIDISKITSIISVVLPTVVDLNVQLARKNQKSDVAKNIYNKLIGLLGHKQELLVDVLLHCKTLLLSKERDPDIYMPIIEQIFNCPQLTSNMQPSLYLKFVVLSKFLLFMAPKDMVISTRKNICKRLVPPKNFKAWAMESKIDWLKCNSWDTKAILKVITISSALEDFYGSLTPIKGKQMTESIVKKEVCESIAIKEEAERSCNGPTTKISDIDSEKRAISNSSIKNNCDLTENTKNTSKGKKGKEKVIERDNEQVFKEKKRKRKENCNELKEDLKINVDLNEEKKQKKKKQLVCNEDNIKSVNELNIIDNVNQCVSNSKKKKKKEKKKVNSITEIQNTVVNSKVSQLHGVIGSNGTDQPAESLDMEVVSEILEKPIECRLKEEKRKKRKKETDICEREKKKKNLDKSSKNIVNYDEKDKCNSQVDSSSNNISKRVSKTDGVIKATEELDYTYVKAESKVIKKKEKSSKKKKNMKDDLKFLQKDVVNTLCDNETVSPTTEGIDIEESGNLLVKNISENSCNKKIKKKKKVKKVTSDEIESDGTLNEQKEKEKKKELTTVEITGEILGNQKEKKKKKNKQKTKHRNGIIIESGKCDDSGKLDKLTELETEGIKPVNTNDIITDTDYRILESNKQTNVDLPKKKKKKKKQHEQVNITNTSECNSNMLLLEKEQTVDVSELAEHSNGMPVNTYNNSEDVNDKFAFEKTSDLLKDTNKTEAIKKTLQKETKMKHDVLKGVSKTLSLKKNKYNISVKKLVKTLSYIVEAKEKNKLKHLKGETSDGDFKKRIRKELLDIITNQEDKTEEMLYTCIPSKAKSENDKQNKTNSNAEVKVTKKSKTISGKSPKHKAEKLDINAQSIKSCNDKLKIDSSERKIKKSPSSKVNAQDEYADKPLKQRHRSNSVPSHKSTSGRKRANSLNFTVSDLPQEKMGYYSENNISFDYSKASSIDIDDVIMDSDIDDKDNEIGNKEYSLNTKPYKENVEKINDIECHDETFEKQDTGVLLKGKKSKKKKEIKVSEENEQIKTPEKLKENIATPQAKPCICSSPKPVEPADEEISDEHIHYKSNFIENVHSSQMTDKISKPVLPVHLDLVRSLDGNVNVGANNNSSHVNESDSDVIFINEIASDVNSNGSESSRDEASVCEGDVNACNENSKIFAEEEIQRYHHKVLELEKKVDHMLKKDESRPNSELCGSCIESLELFEKTKSDETSLHSKSETSKESSEDNERNIDLILETIKKDTGRESSIEGIKDCLRDIVVNKGESGKNSKVLTNSSHFRENSDGNGVTHKLDNETNNVNSQCLKGIMQSLNKAQTDSDSQTCSVNVEKDRINDIKGKERVNSKELSCIENDEEISSEIENSELFNTIDKRVALRCDNMDKGMCLHKEQCEKSDKIKNDENIFNDSISEQEKESNLIPDNGDFHSKNLAEKAVKEIQSENSIVSNNFANQALKAYSSEHPGSVKDKFVTDIVSKEKSVHDILNEEKSVSDVNEEKFVIDIIDEEKSVNDIVSEEKSVNDIANEEKSVNYIANEEKSENGISEEKSVNNIASEETSPSPVKSVLKLLPEKNVDNINKQIKNFSKDAKSSVLKEVKYDDKTGDKYTINSLGESINHLHAAERSEIVLKAQDTDMSMKFSDTFSDSSYNLFGKADSETIENSDTKVTDNVQSKDKDHISSETESLPKEIKRNVANKEFEFSSEFCEETSSNGDEAYEASSDASEEPITIHRKRTRSQRKQTSALRAAKEVSDSDLSPLQAAVKTRRAGNRRRSFSSSMNENLKLQINALNETDSSSNESDNSNVDADEASNAIVKLTESTQKQIEKEQNYVKENYTNKTKEVELRSKLDSNKFSDGESSTSTVIFTSSLQCVPENCESNTVINSNLVRTTLTETREERSDFNTLGELETSTSTVIFTSSSQNLQDKNFDAETSVSANKVEISGGNPEFNKQMEINKKCIMNGFDKKENIDAFKEKTKLFDSETRSVVNSKDMDKQKTPIAKEKDNSLSNKEISKNNLDFERECIGQFSSVTNEENEIYNRNEIFGEDEGDEIEVLSISEGDDEFDYSQALVMKTTAGTQNNLSSNSISKPKAVRSRPKTQMLKYSSSDHNQGRKKPNLSGSDNELEKLDIPQGKAQCVSKTVLTKELLISPEVSDEECELVSPGESSEYDIKKNISLVEDLTASTPTYKQIKRRGSFTSKGNKGNICSPQKVIPEEQDETSLQTSKKKSPKVNSKMIGNEINSGEDSPKMSLRKNIKSDGTPKTPLVNKVEENTKLKHKSPLTKNVDLSPRTPVLKRIESPSTNSGKKKDAKLNGNCDSNEKSVYNNADSSGKCIQRKGHSKSSENKSPTKENNIASVMSSITDVNSSSKLTTTRTRDTESSNLSMTSSTESVLITSKFSTSLKGTNDSKFCTPAKSPNSNGNSIEYCTKNSITSSGKKNDSPSNIKQLIIPKKSEVTIRSSKISPKNSKLSLKSPKRSNVEELTTLMNSNSNSVIQSPEACLTRRSIEKQELNSSTLIECSTFSSNEVDLTKESNRDFNSPQGSKRKNENTSRSSSLDNQNYLDIQQKELKESDNDSAEEFKSPRKTRSSTIRTKVDLGVNEKEKGKVQKPSARDDIDLTIQQENSQERNYESDEECVIIPRKTRSLTKTTSIKSPISPSKSLIRDGEKEEFNNPSKINNLELNAKSDKDSEKENMETSPIKAKRITKSPQSSPKLESGGRHKSEKICKESNFEEIYNSPKDLVIESPRKTRNNAKKKNTDLHTSSNNDEENESDNVTEEFIKEIPRITRTMTKIINAESPVTSLKTCIKENENESDDTEKLILTNSEKNTNAAKKRNTESPVACTKIKNKEKDNEESGNSYEDFVIEIKHKTRTTAKQRNSATSLKTNVSNTDKENKTIKTSIKCDEDSNVKSPAIFSVSESSEDVEDNGPNILRRSRRRSNVNENSSLMNKKDDPSLTKLSELSETKSDTDTINPRRSKRLSNVNENSSVRKDDLALTKLYESTDEDTLKLRRSRRLSNVIENSSIVNRKIDPSLTELEELSDSDTLKLRRSRRLSNVNENSLVHRKEDPSLTNLNESSETESDIDLLRVKSVRTILKKLSLESDEESFLSNKNVEPSPKCTPIKAKEIEITSNLAVTPRRSMVNSSNLYSPAKVLFSQESKKEENESITPLKRRTRSCANSSEKLSTTNP